MKRRITLYIAGQPCDLQDDALVLLNYQREDLYNPAVVRNSYSQAVTLPGTPANDRIFGHYFRVDHAVAGGFNPLVRVPFSIFDATGEILVTGYCKLLNVTTERGAHTYEVQLYGSLGEFIYGLAYDADGNKKSLASLDYIGGGDTELDFVIDKTAVTDAWARLGGDTSKPAMWDVVNFAPCYNGIPDGDFDAGKALAKPAEVGLTIPAGQQASSGGYTLLELAANLDEWEARDLRSYLQRPVLSVKALLEAIAKPENNGGWTIDLSDIDTTAEWPYLRTWITRPLLPSLGTFKQSSAGLSVTFDNTAVGQRVAKFDVSGNLPGEKVFVQMKFKPVLSIPGQSAAHIYMQAASAGEPNYTFGVLTFIQPIAYDSSSNIVGYGNVLTLCSNPNIGADALAAYVGFTPQGDAALISTQADGDYDLMTAGIYKDDKAVTLEVAGIDIASVRIMQTAYIVGWNNATNVLTSRSGSGTSAWACGWTDPSTSLSRADADGAASADGTGTTTSTPDTSIRSGARITKRMLLSTEGTPADYLLSICKSFGLYILADGATKTARIVRRSTLYQNETIDLTERVDTSQEVELQPLAIESKYYVWKHDDVGAAFGKEYKENTGRDYGAQRVNTGYDFDAKARDVLDGVVLKGTAAVVKFGRFMIQAPVSLSPANTIGVPDLTINPGQSTNNTTYIWLQDFGDEVVGFVRAIRFRTIVGTINIYKVTISNGVGTATLLTSYTASAAGQVVELTLNENFSSGDCIGVNGAITYKSAGMAGFVGGYIAAGGGVVTYATGFALWLQLDVLQEIVTPPVFILPGSKYTLWDSNNDSQENAVPQYVGAVTPLRSIGPYDFYDKAQFHEKDGKPVDGADVLLLYNGTGDALRSYPLEITDDVPDMDTLNGKPCWLFTNNTTPLQLPYFSRYDINLAGWVTLSLDFGVPGELDIPNLDYFDASTIYAKAWRRYVADRLSVDTKILRCRVRLDGLQVGQGLLRKFYWYRGALWALNKIENYSLTTFDLAECEFVQVQDIDAYLNG